MVDAAVATNVRRTTRNAARMGERATRSGCSAVLLMRYDVANLKAVARAFHAGRAGAEGREDAVEAVAVATLPAGELERERPRGHGARRRPAERGAGLAIRGHPLADDFRRAVAAYAASATCSSLELALDLAFYGTRARWSATRTPRRRSSLPRGRDRRTNLATAVKLRGREVRRRAVLRGGWARLARARTGRSPPRARRRAAGAPAAVRGIGRGVRRRERRGQLRTVLERFAKTLTTDPLDIGLVTHYLRAKEREAAQLRLIARGTYYGVPAATLQKGARPCLRCSWSPTPRPRSASGWRASRSWRPPATGPQASVEAAIVSDRYGLVVVDESLMGDPVKAMERVMRGRDLPVLLPMPGLSAAFDHEADATAYMQQLVRSAIGFDIKLD
jgi:V/A-type H+/Na+-transporting ATPase subunit F